MFGRDENKIKVQNGQITTILGEDSLVEGKLVSKSSIRIDGMVNGGVVSEGTIVLSQSGQIQGNVIAENIIVSGVVDGNMVIKDKVNIEPTGEVYGDITTSRILVDEQSTFQGKCNMNKDKNVEKKRRLIRRQEPITYSDPDNIGPVKPSNKAKKSRKDKPLNIEVLDPELEAELRRENNQE